MLLSHLVRYPASTSAHVCYSEASHFKQNEINEPGVLLVAASVSRGNKIEPRTLTMWVKGSGFAVLRYASKRADGGGDSLQRLLNRAEERF